MSKRIYIICPVRHITPEQTEEISKYVSDLEKKSYIVFFPPRDAPQEAPIGVIIVKTEVKAISNSDEVHVFWKKDSTGSHFDLGVAMALGKKVVFVKSFLPDNEGKSYEKVIRAYAERAEVRDDYECPKCPEMKVYQYPDGHMYCARCGWTTIH